MGSKKRRRLGKSAQASERSGFSYKKITATVLCVFAMGFFVKIAFFPENLPVDLVRNDTLPTVATSSYDNQVRLVASKFKCACGGCGELPLVECTCDMPRGAQETKRFIRNKLREGLTTDQVVLMVKDAYGHMIT